MTKQLSSFVLIIVFFTLSCLELRGQTTTYLNPLTGNSWSRLTELSTDNMVYTMQQMQQYNMQLANAAIASALIVQAYKQEYGQKKINAGQATTRFVSSPQKSVVEEMAATAQTPAEKQKLKATAAAALHAFNEVMQSKGLTPNDMADANALAVILCYLVYKNEDPGTARLNKLRAYNKQDMLKNVIFQGTPNEEHQKKYESRAIRTMLALMSYQQTKNPKFTIAEKQAAQENAKNYAAAVFKELWSGTLDALELSDNQYGFADKGERLVKSNSGATTFERIEGKSAWAENNAYCFYKDSFNRIPGETKCFYDMRTRFDTEVKATGGEINDLAYANAAAFKILYEIYTLGRVKLNNQQFNWVLSEMRKDILGSVELQNQTNEQKQQNYDYLVFTAMLARDNYTGSMRKMNEYKDDFAEGGLRRAYESAAKIEAASAKNKLQNIFQPRNFDDFELRQNGFVKVK